MKATRWLAAVAMVLAAGLGAAAPAKATLLFQYDFTKQVQDFSGTDGWVSRYCSDPWTTAGVPGLTPQTDDGCVCDYSAGPVCDYGMTTGGFGGCSHSEALDNHIVNGDVGWSDYLFTARFKNSDDDTMGFVFRYTSSASYYLLTFSIDQTPTAADGCDETFTGARLIRVWPNQFDGYGQAEILDASDTTFVPGVLEAVAIRLEGTRITVRFGPATPSGEAPDTVLFDVQDDPAVALPSGKIGFFAFENGLAGTPACQSGGCYFEAPRVWTLDSIVPEPVPEFAEALPEYPEPAPEFVEPAPEPGPDLPVFLDTTWPDPVAEAGPEPVEDVPEAAGDEAVAGNDLPVVAPEETPRDDVIEAGATAEEDDAAAGVPTGPSMHGPGGTSGGCAAGATGGAGLGPCSVLVLVLVLVCLTNNARQGARDRRDQLQDQDQGLDFRRDHIPTCASPSARLRRNSR